MQPTKYDSIFTNSALINDKWLFKMNSDIVLSVIIVSFQTRDLTLRAIGAALDQDGPSKEVIVVDNASTDGTCDAIAISYPNIKLIKKDFNIGFARANNIAANVASGKYILLMNPDAVPAIGAFSEIIDFARQQPQAMIWGGRVITTDNRVNSSCMRRPTLWSVVAQAAGLASLWPSFRYFNAEAMPGWDAEEQINVDIVTGCFLLIERNVWHILGGFDPAFFMYGEDVDLCLRAASIGARPAITLKAIIMHVGGASQEPTSRGVQILAGRIRYIIKHMPKFQAKIAIWSVRAGVALRILFYSTKSVIIGNNSGLHRMLYIWRKRDLWWYGYPGE
jgi:N-acetylglucosaminyl-diphospho-decaprenol L-rhamnosyltransferase